MKAGKVWGETREIWANGAFEMHRLVVKEGGYCSKHRHLHKYNLFYVERGKLKIKTWKNDYDLVDETILDAGDSFVQKPLEYHQFEALEESVVFEVYWGKFEHSDIQREDVGGVS